PHSNYLMSRWDLIPQETCFWRRGLLEKCGNINEAYGFAMDYELFVQYMKGGRFKRVNRFLGAFRHHEQSKTCMLMATVGEKEIEQVRRRYGITPNGPERILGGLFSSGARVAGTLYALAGRMCPSDIPRIGHKYEELWGDLLDSPVGQGGAKIGTAS